MIGIIDYGLGNLFSIHNALKSIGIPSEIITSLKQFDDCDKLILPGVGAFPEGMRYLSEKGFAEKLKDTKKLILGICLGMQLLFEVGEEFVETKGLGLIPGRVVPLKKPGNYKIPHMGWNQLNLVNKNKIIDSVDNQYVYFVHSYKALTDSQYIIATCDYCQSIPAIVRKDNVYGTQFHPEKSGDVGIKILKNFNNIVI